MSLNVAVIGPGRSKQGTGPYIARTFHEQGACISGMTSSSLESATNAVKELKTEFGIATHAYTNLHELLEKKPIDIIAICSPSASHHQYLKVAVKAGCHIFCEKPLWWPSTGIKTETDIQHITTETTQLVDLCKTQNAVLQLNTQWPFTLPTYYEIFPEGNQTTEPIESFAMWLSPQSADRTMIIDAVPHLLSMLYALVGAGRIQNIESNYLSIKSNDEINIEFDYLHATGDTKVSLSLISTATMPKPAAYAINGKRVDRHVEPTNYLLSLHSSDKQLPMVDPLECSIKNFLSSIHSKSSLDETALIDSMTHLAQIYQAVI